MAAHSRAAHLPPDRPWSAPTFRRGQGGRRLVPRCGRFSRQPWRTGPQSDAGNGHIHLQPGKTLTIEGVRYTTDASNPFRGSGHSEISPVAPVITVGWGNLIPRDYHQRLSFPIEIGAAYEGAPTAHVSTSGDICPAGQSCRLASTDAGFNQNLNTALRDVNSNLDRYARFFPIISVGVGYRF